MDSTENQKGASTVANRFSGAPQIIQSAAFGIFFTAAIFLTVLGSLYAISSNASRNAQAYPILLYNLAIIVLLGAYLGIRVWNILFAKRFRRTAPLLRRRFVLRIFERLSVSGTARVK